MGKFFDIHKFYPRIVSSDIRLQDKEFLIFKLFGYLCCKEKTYFKSKREY